MLPVALRRIRFFPGVLLSVIACTSTSTPRSHEGASEQRPAPPEVAAPQGSPPKAQPAGEPPSLCPLAIEPGVALGPIRVGQTREELERSGWSLEGATVTGNSTFVDLGPLKVRLCADAVYEVWLEDLRETKPCVTVGQRKIPPTMARDELTRLFEGCEDAPPRTGGAFIECANGGVRFGHGMGDFLQIRVAKAGYSIDDDCSHVLDSGAPVALPASELAPLVEQVLDLRALSPFWHPDQPGRKPVRIAPRSAFEGVQPWHKLGVPVQFVEASRARADGQPFFEVTKIDATATRLELRFEYAVEGIVGGATFKKRGDAWYMVHHEVAER